MVNHAPNPSGAACPWPYSPKRRLDRFWFQRGCEGQAERVERITFDVNKHSRFPAQAHRPLANRFGLARRKRHKQTNRGSVRGWRKTISSLETPSIFQMFVPEGLEARIVTRINPSFARPYIGGTPGSLDTGILRFRVGDRAFAVRTRNRVAC